MQRALRQGGGSRAGLARESCERDGWRNPGGKLCAASARKARTEGRLRERLTPVVGWRPSKRQPLPGNEVLWRAYVRLQTMVLGMQTLRGP